MGNTENKNSNLNVHIDTQKDYYNSGSIIKGVVFVEAKENFTYSALFIRVEGDQFCQWFQGSSKNRRKFTGNENFYAVEHMLAKYDDMIQQGKYAYPFSLQLSENIPGSFKSSYYDARVDYKLIAYFANFSQGKKNIYHQIPLYIRQPFRQEICEYEGTSRQSPNSLWFFNKGQIEIRARFSKNVCFDTDDEIEVEISCDNRNGKADVKRFGVELAQYTFVSANNGINRTYRKLIKREYYRKPVPKGEESSPIREKFQIPTVPLQTAISTLVANYYRIEVYPDLGMLVKDYPCIYSPLFIMKRNLSIKKKNLKQGIKNLNPSQFKNAGKTQIFKAPEYWFRKNKNLSVMNFRLEDGVEPNQSQLMMR